ncbi:MAG: phosphate ABC transporter permease PstA [Devosia sp.]|jgi:phosphate transport system permease protein|uniref:phosphate ABC transporter permease PstA n=1 Tax=Devosia sp. XGJD_8 TaxID=3391187 RepID=UPI001DBA68B5|nr:phosphate ABC transporter permease PstA [Alphaproteobacteria bacterium]MBU1560060.1 phosphate ABC transporter permease PstA [Alphaproteobacteria bacterium]MBU2301237.1 phosphate ABC transporter permease PstA [Alphaproteobacteria bacterium]MBU2366668.1 phosphate ABC transporter permease PstA [Alphaproteobacteria bacterium]
MTDATLPTQVQTAAINRARLRNKRNAADFRLRAYGITAISIAVGLLGILLFTLVLGGYSAFVQTHIRVDFPISAEYVDPADPAEGNWRAVVSDGVGALLPSDSPAQARQIAQILTNNTQFFVRNAVVADPSVIGGTLTLDIPAADIFDQLNKGNIDRNTPEANRRVTDQQIEWFDSLQEQGRVSTPFNWGLFFNADSRFPELAGLSGAITGSFYALLVCFLISFPVGIAAATYLEEFAPKNRWTDLIEVNINNLAAVPSIVFGLLGLAVFLQIFGLPRSAPLVGGLVLALMTLPTIIIVTRNALKAVPPSIREAAYGMGASPQQVILHHVLPLSLPGILTGTIIGLAQALGETAPLLLIGMNAFITSPPGGVLEASTALPTQIYIWADSPERGFVSRTSAGILVLMGFLLLMNAVAIFLRQRLERRW